MSEQQNPTSQRTAGWTTDTELIREFDHPVDVADAVVSAVEIATEEWPEHSETPPLAHFVDVENLDGLFKTKATDDSGWLPSAAFQFQDCQVTVLYGPTVRVIIRRDS
jgi:hypothetical protein